MTTKRFVLFVMVPASASKIILMGCLTTPIREPATSPTSTSLSGSARTVITVLYVIAPTVESRFRGTEHFATATPLCSVASRKKAAKKKNGSKKQKSTSRMRSGRCLQWHKATFTLTTKDISSAGRISLIAGMKIVKSSRRSRCTYGAPIAWPGISHRRRLR